LSSFCTISSYRQQDVADILDLIGWSAILHCSWTISRSCDAEIWQNSITFVLYCMDLYLLLGLGCCGLDACRNIYSVEKKVKQYVMW